MLLVNWWLSQISYELIKPQRIDLIVWRKKKTCQTINDWYILWVINFIRIIKYKPRQQYEAWMIHNRSKKKKNDRIQQNFAVRRKWNLIDLWDVNDNDPFHCISFYISSASGQSIFFFCYFFFLIIKWMLNYIVYCVACRANNNNKNWSIKRNLLFT